MTTVEWLEPETPAPTPTSLFDLVYVDGNHAYDFRQGRRRLRGREMIKDSGVPGVQLIIR